MPSTDKLIRTLRSLLPAPFTIAVVLTAVTFIAALLFTRPEGEGFVSYWFDVIEFWESGLWTNGLLVFALQMMLMLVLGHALALSKPVDKAINYFTERFCSTAASAAFSVTLLTVIVALYNWGLGLIFGAIFARKVGEYAARNGIKINYPLIGAAGYSGLMVWHGGFSGSSLSKIAEPGHIRSMVDGAKGFSEEKLALLPDVIDYTETVFGSMNIGISFMLILILPLAMRFLAKRSLNSIPVLKTSSIGREVQEETSKMTLAENLDHSKWIAWLFGGLIFATAIYKAVTHPGFSDLRFINPNWINLSLLGLGIVFHSRFSSFLKAIDEAISGAAGILIQFPLYFGIMGIMSNSGMVEMISRGFVSLCEASSNPETLYPILTFFSAGLVNIFVPSGGGQWAVQGPIIIQAATDMGVPLTKSIMAMAYGDQLTNMLQPFWALPLLGITGLKAKEILPYTLFLMLLGVFIFIFGLLVF